jgi:hypothetical protein
MISDKYASKSVNMAVSGHMTFVLDKVALPKGFLRVLRIPLPIFISPISLHITMIYHLGLVQ